MQTKINNTVKPNNDGPASGAAGTGDPSVVQEGLTLPTVMEFLSDRCCVKPARATVERFLAGEIAGHPKPKEPWDLVRWAEFGCGARVRPTLTPAHASGEKAPRLLVVAQADALTDELLERFRTYGFDVAYLTPCRPTLRERRAGVPAIANPEVATMVDTHHLDAAWLELDDPEVLLMHVELMRERGIPTVVNAMSRIADVPAAVSANATFVANGIAEDDVSAIITAHFPAR